MPIEVTRKQHAVGQGYFHTGELRREGSVHARYVVDCGAMSKYAPMRDERIDRYIDFVRKQNGLLDLLFISHAHDDHLNGVPRLLDKAHGLKVETIVMPLLEVHDLLMAFARAAVEDLPSSEEAFFRNFVIDPVSAVGRFGPRRILLVRAGDGDDGAPFSNPNVEPRPADDPDPGPANPDRRSAWKLIGRGHPRGEPPTQDGATQVAVVPDSLGFGGVSPLGDLDWLLAPYVDPSVKAQKATFMNALAGAIGKTASALRSWLRRKANLEALLTNNVQALKVAYEAVERDLNITSMCLYSGPAGRIPSSQTTLFEADFGAWGGADRVDREVAWLGTADAALKDNKRRGLFLKHYDELLEQVVTLTVPHHGSDHNFHPDLLTRIRPTLCVAAADQFSTWRHPGSWVTQCVASSGRFLSVVTSDRRSEVFERLEVG